VKLTELIQLLQKDLEVNGDRDAVLETERQLLPNKTYDLSIDATGSRFVLRAR
jgi:hypothetical protein